MSDTLHTVLIVDDEDAVRNLIRTLFRLAGYEVLSCPSGPEALDLMAARGGNVHLLVTDINLGPLMDGIELAESLRAFYPALKVLYISGMEERERLDPELAGGRAHFLQKPFKTREITAKADEMLSRSTVTAASR
jgi:two-component system, cell cycle sensor histidine kinase and response regulator CckA